MISNYRREHASDQLVLAVSMYQVSDRCHPASFEQVNAFPPTPALLV